MIDIQNLHFAYKKKKVFTGLNLSLQAGHIYGLLGKNGTGKSTLLRNIAGLLFPDQGTVKVLSHTPGLRQPDFLQELFMVPEEFYLPNVTIKKFVDCNAPFYPRFNQPQFNNYLKEFEIPIDNKLQQMSYGQKKKALISFGLACNTSLLLMDEPTNGLDIMSKSQFRKVIAGAIDDSKCIIICTHQVKDMESLIDRITIIDEGKILFDQTVDQITSRLSFKISFDSAEVKEALYREESLKGNAIITANNDDEEGKLDLEMLYKAIVTNGEAIRSTFK
ncbi:ABC transporter ATP-binding protein [Terrimonas pollutisoli]|uniref:ABC transporter ATP-binding protein n=1 Tax=Terrimonas pollutisoli TaxID=3034147 RepID=UPI0023EA792B|nr:ABC transporter ATP-binding protein [Terrimonas sp. H1YJ31]